jgi:hypothetical protein
LRLGRRQDQFAAIVDGRLGHYQFAVTGRARHAQATLGRVARDVLAADGTRKLDFTHERDRWLQSKDDTRCAALQSGFYTDFTRGRAEDWK